MSRHQFAHGGDLHLGPGRRNADRRRVFSTFVDELSRLPHLAATLLPGDLNHARMEIPDRNYLIGEIKRAAQHGPIIITPGNHDLEGDLSMFGELGTKYPVFVVDAPKVITFTAATGATVTAFCLRYPTAGSLVASGVAPGDVGAVARQMLEAIFRDAALQLETARARGHITLFVGHVNVGGSLTATGQPNIGQEIEVDGSLLALLGDCYKGLNHIHKGQEIHGAWYPGSFCRLDWGEIDPKRWLRVDYTEAETGWAYAVEPQPIAVAPMYHVEGRLTREAFDWVVKDGPEGAPLDKPASWSGCEVRVRYTFDASERAMLEIRRGEILATFADAAHLELEPVAQPDRALRAPAVAAAKTLPDKLRAWADLNPGTVVTDRVLAKLVQAEGDPTVLLADLQALADALVTPAPTPAPLEVSA